MKLQQALLIIVLAILPFISAAQNPSSKEFEEVYTRALLIQNRDVIEADSLTDVLVEMSVNESPYWYFKAKALDARVDSYFGNYKGFKEMQSITDSLLKIVSDEQEKMEIKLYWTNKLRSEKKLDTARLVLRELKNYFVAKRDFDHTAATYRYIGLTYVTEKIQDSIEFYYDKAIKYATRAKSQEIIPIIYHNLSRIYKRDGFKEKAVEKETQAMKAAEKFGMTYTTAAYSNSLGVFQKELNNNEESIFYYQKALDLARECNSKRLEAMTLSNMGNSYKDLGQYETALPFHQEAIEINKWNGSTKSLGDNYTNLGIVYNRLKDYKKAKENYMIALPLFEDAKRPDRVARVYHNLAVTEHNLKNYARAEEYAKESVRLKIENKRPNEVYSTYTKLSEILSAQNKYEEAFKYLKISTDYNDSIQGLETQEKIAELSKLYRAEQREKLINSQNELIENQKNQKLIQDQEIEVTKLRGNLKSNVILGLLLLVLLALTIGFYRYKQNKLKQKQRVSEMNQTLLRSQMNPHFVFNAMSVIQSYIYDNDTKNSSRFLVNFSKLMRLILENSSKEFIPLETEIEILNKYLLVQKLRFEDRFEFEIDYADEILEDEVMIPPMVTQPFIENAIEHGQLHEVLNGMINIVFSKSDNGKNLIVKIEDNGVGRASSAANKKSAKHKSMAMTITKRRIDLMNAKYKTHGFMRVIDIDENDSSGTKVILSLPYKQAKKQLKA